MISSQIKQAAYILASLAEQDLMFHGNKDEWYSLTIYLAGLSKLLYVPTQEVIKILDELIETCPNGIKMRNTSAMAKGWLLLDINITGMLDYM